ncbi:hypothetical protein [Leuconostoc mesenteroides]|uniref:hypothetical protein n=1 Tax=Leuconostoc mesenteroides TaxID=1245 RepID=UPI002361D5DE|nr:hypothetical protein [Leuconostoc mesenteroides]
MKQLVRIIWKSILTFDGIVFCSSVGAAVWFSLLKKFPFINISASTAKMICHYLFILFTITIVLNVLLGCIMIVVDMWCKSDDDFEQGGLIFGTAKSEQIPFMVKNKVVNPSKPTPTKMRPAPVPAPIRSLDRGVPTKPTKK